MVVDRAVVEDTGAVARRDPVDRVALVVVDMGAVPALHNFQYYRLHSHPKNHQIPHVLRVINGFYQKDSHQLRAANL
jgi:hypothetical protein